MTSKPWSAMDSEIIKKRNCNARGGADWTAISHHGISRGRRPRHSASYVVAPLDRRPIVLSLFEGHSPVLYLASAAMPWFGGAYAFILVPNPRPLCFWPATFALLTSVGLFALFLPS